MISDSQPPSRQRELFAGVLTVPCSFCLARAGEECVNMADRRKALKRPHPERQKKYSAAERRVRPRD